MAVISFGEVDGCVCVWEVGEVEGGEGRLEATRCCEKRVLMKLPPACRPDAAQAGALQHPTGVQAEG